MFDKFRYLGQLLQGAAAISSLEKGIAILRRLSSLEVRLSCTSEYLMQIPGTPSLSTLNCQLMTFSQAKFCMTLSIACLALIAEHTADRAKLRKGVMEMDATQAQAHAPSLHRFAKVSLVVRKVLYPQDVGED